MRAEGQPLEAVVQLVAILRRHAPTLVADVSPDAHAVDLADTARRGLDGLREPSLLVLDNVSGRGFVELLPGNQVRVLLTTRDRRLGLGKAIALDVLSSDDARALAIELAGVVPSSEAEATALVRVADQHLGGLAVAVEVAAHAVATWAGGWVAYERLLMQQQEAALDAPEDRSEHYPRGVFAALDLSIERCGGLTRRLLEGAVVFAPDAVPLGWACAVAQAEPDSVSTRRALGELLGLGLV